MAIITTPIDLLLSKVNELKVKDITGDLNLITKIAKTCHNQPIKKFFFDFQSYRSPKNDKMVSNAILDFNLILEALEDNHKIVTLERTSNRIKNLHKLVDIKEGFVIDSTREILFRNKVDVDYNLDFSNGVHQMIITPNDETPFESYVALTYIRKKMTSAERGIEFKLTLAQLSNLLKRKRCYYSGVTMDLTGGVHTLTLDRIDSKKGYTIDNVVVCSSLVNQIKNKLIDDGVNLDKLKSSEMKKMLISFSEVL